MIEKKKVALIGAAGHVGIPLSLVIANTGQYEVYGIDTNLDMCDMLNDGEVPFVEDRAKEYLRKALDNNVLSFSNNFFLLDKADYVIVIIGTPMGIDGNPQMRPIITLVDEKIVPMLQRAGNRVKHIILRSTVCPGTTELLKRRIEERTGLKESVNFFLTFCPERVSQGHGITESQQLPQLIGAFTDAACRHASHFFGQFVTSMTIQLSPKEAEFAKLITNTWRYVNFALANEFYVLASDQGVNIHNVIKAANHEYPRMDCPLPGPNVGGPCLSKDGKFLLTEMQFPDIIRAAYDINEGMPGFIVKKIKEKAPSARRVGILGMEFKADCDDRRNSLSSSLKSLLELNGFDVGTVEYNSLTSSNGDAMYDVLHKSDVIVLMTPHDNYKGLVYEYTPHIPYETLIIDIWKFWDLSKRTVDGFYTIKEFRDS